MINKITKHNPKIDDKTHCKNNKLHNPKVILPSEELDQDSNEISTHDFYPVNIVYSASQGHYYIDRGSYYRVYNKKTPVLNGIRNYFESIGEKDNARGLARDSIEKIETDQAVDWAGSIAGYNKGRMKFDGFEALITREAKLIEPVEGSFPVISKILNDALGDGNPFMVFIAWLSIALKAIINSSHQPGQLLVLAGQANTGKSLLCKLISSVMGSRTADPYTAWNGTLPWNDDLIAAELLVIDDSVSSTDPRARRNLGSRFKEAIYSNEVQLRKRQTTNISIRPAWRCLICCNDNPDALQIIPPIDDDLLDKVSILRVSKITPPVDTSTTEGRAEFWALIEDELPAFVNYLLSFKTPDHLKDSRAGVIAFRDKALEQAVLDISPENRFLEMLLRIFDTNYFCLKPGEHIKLTATELESQMTDQESPVQGPARNLLQKWSGACGTYLSKLASSKPHLIKKLGKNSGVQKWQITRPNAE